jgi:circadian clock protein KaiB
VVDLMDEPARARTDGVIAVPTLVRVSPEPTRKIVGDLSDTARLLAGLELPVLQTDTP